MAVRRCDLLLAIMKDTRTASTVPARKNIGPKVDPENQFKVLCIIRLSHLASTRTELYATKDKLRGFIVEDMVSEADGDREKEW